ncbi:uncharacterized protein EI97DRAFT_445698 [Westerdykella ornata]|uniref:BTB domain-containing protein n=1 Tax=Westerdykella ornata TaxID=318751 RepID=A0A6A6J7E0_WESOR|nr:uncharacterized protein EI97DRAFT_445698 [Westerdykella ornata]KAF2272490.1 hypothetical protein EI97DRAFT_445698 [Westerdykella ornata]
MAEPTLTVKLRNTYVDPPTTQTFVLPRNRAIATSLYLRAHTQPSDHAGNVTHGSSPSQYNTSAPKRKHDGITRLNFPDFDIFAIYVAWLNSGAIHTKDGLRGHGVPANDTLAIAQQRLRLAFTDYLGLYFLGCWLQDDVFRDCLVSVIVSSINEVGRIDTAAHSASPSSYYRLSVEQAAQCFLEALKPSIVDLVLTDEKASLHLRRLMYAGIKKWAAPEHMGMWVPKEGRTCERGFVRGLLGWLVVGARERDGGKHHSAREDGDKGKSGISSETGDDGWTSVSPDPAWPTPELEGGNVAQGPPGWALPMRDMWTPQSDVEWSDAGASRWSGAERGLAEDDGVAKRGSDAESLAEMYVEWPEREEEDTVVTDGPPDSLVKQIMYSSYTMLSGEYQMIVHV